MSASASEQTLATVIEGGKVEPEVDFAHASQDEWYLSEGVPGSGPRPDYLESKYKSVADQAKAYKEAQKLIGTNASAPESYDFGDLQQFIDQDNPHITEFINFAKENKLQQDTFSKVLKTYVDYDNSRKPDVNQEIAKLGDNGANKVTTIQQWIKNNFSEKSFNALEKLPVKAEVIMMLDEMRQKHMNTMSKIPVGDIGSDFTQLTVKQVEDEMFNNMKRYESDSRYREEISRKFEQAVGS